MSGLLPASAWTEGVDVVDRHGILLPGDLPAGAYRLLIGLYDPASGARLPVESEDGVVFDGALPLGTVTVVP